MVYARLISAKIWLGEKQSAISSEAVNPKMEIVALVFPALIITKIIAENARPTHFAAIIKHCVPPTKVVRPPSLSYTRMPRTSPTSQPADYRMTHFKDESGNWSDRFSKNTSTQASSVETLSVKTGECSRHPLQEFGRSWHNQFFLASLHEYLDRMFKWLAQHTSLRNLVLSRCLLIPL